jgi:hypothetical protein
MARLHSSKLDRVLQKTMPTRHIRFQDLQTINGRRLAHVRILLAERVVAMAIGLAPNNSKGVNGVEMSGLR